MGAALKTMASSPGPTASRRTAEDETSYLDVSIANVILHVPNGNDSDVCSVSYTLSSRFHRPLAAAVDVSVNGEGWESHTRYTDSIGPNRYMVEQSGEPFLLPVFCCLPHTVQPLGHALPALCRAHVRWNA